MTAYATSQLLKRATAALTGKTRGPDHDPEGKRRTPHRDSYDVDDVRAKPWRPIGDGSVRQGLAYREALTEAAEEWYQQSWRDYPLSEIRAARARYAELSAELDRYIAGDAAPVGRPAIVRRELGEVTGYLRSAEGRLRRVDVTILKAVLKTLDFATGKLFPSHETIAQRAGCHVNSVKNALRRLRAHGFIAWVRRTVKTGNDTEFAPQREQTSNAYYFQHRQDMPPRVFQRYWQLVVSKLRRLGFGPGSKAQAAPREVKDPDMRQAIADLAAHFPSPSAST